MIYITGGDGEDIVFGQEGNDEYAGDVAMTSSRRQRQRSYLSGNEDNDFILGDAGDD